ncbi:hypothetical protein [Streptomyces sp. NPDC048521]|uniref:hypothetical protein n=1 Tax=Streptomyces sp. NPDC048521 TaxID=3365566 RepID=UPI00370FE5E8
MNRFVRRLIRAAATLLAVGGQEAADRCGLAPTAPRDVRPVRSADAVRPGP